MPTATRQLNDETAERLFEHGVRVVATTAVMRTPEDLYDAWRDLRDLPRIAKDIEEVATVGDGVSRWTLRLPTGAHSWEAEIINDEPGRVIAWKTTEGAGIPNAGSVRFRELPTDHGTEVRVTIEYVPPGRKLGELAARAANLGVKAKVRDALHRFRQVMETGEVATSTGQPAGSNRRRHDRPGESDDDGADREVRDIADADAQGFGEGMHDGPAHDEALSTTHGGAQPHHEHDAQTEPTDTEVKP